MSPSPTRRGAWLLGLPQLCALLLVACEASPPRELEDPRLGVATKVLVLDAGFVKFEGRREALDFFLVEMRRRVRLAAGDPEQLPRVQIEIAPDAAGVDGAWLSRLRDELDKAGVRFLSLG